MTTTNTQEIRAWCLSCRETQPMTDTIPCRVASKSGSTRLAHKGKCAVCGSKITTLGYGRGMPPRKIPPKPNVIRSVHTECPRCTGFIRTADDEYYCLVCGWSAAAPVEVQDMVSSVLHYVRYVGEHVWMEDKVVSVLVGGQPRCPWEGDVMEKLAVSGRRPRKDETRHGCPYGHRISLYAGGLGGWE